MTSYEYEITAYYACGFQAKIRQYQNGKYFLRMEPCWVFGKDGFYHGDPVPSQRTEAFMEATGFETDRDAYVCWCKAVGKEPKAKRI